MSKVSIFKKLKDVNNPWHRDISVSLDRIRKGNSKDLIEQIRQLPKDKANVLKAELPCVCFSGTFKNRSAKGLINHSGYIVLDFDDIGPENVESEKEKLKANEYIFSLWISPSGTGLKGLVKVPTDAENHKGYFVTFEKYLNHPNFDDSGKDVCRVCYESYDSEIYINEDSLLWDELEEPEIEDIGTNTPTIPVHSENRIIENLITWWQKKYGANKGSRNNNLFKLSSAFNDFGVNKTEAERILLQYAEKDFPQSEIKTLINSAYKKNHQFGTKFFEDETTKEQVEKLIRAGKSQKDIVNSFPDNEIEDYIETVKDNLDIDEYWYFDDKNKIKMHIHKYKFWLEQNNFFKYYPSETSNTFSFIKKEQNLLEESNEKRIKDYVLNDILERPKVGFTPYNFMASNTRYFQSDFLSLLDTAEVKIKEDSKEKCYLYFKNCVVEITKNGTRQIDYLDIDGYVWKRQIIDREYKKYDHHKAEFRTFIWRISGQNEERYNTLKSVIGYLLHSYKNSANNKAIVLNDETISENPNGGSGKGLFWNALKHMKKVSSIDGKTFDFAKSFPYQTVSTDTQILVFDDVKKNFNFENLFSLITEGITLEYKGQDAVIIPVEQSPKILITTNYTIGGVGGSHERRKFEVEMSSYFSYKHTPLDEFGHMLFADWDEKEWLRFDNYMIECEMYYLKNGLVSSAYNNLEERKLIKETSFEFYEWAKDGNLPIDVRLYKSNKKAEFLSEYPESTKYVTQRSFTKWMDIYGRYLNCDVRSSRDQAGRYLEYIPLNKEDIPEEDQDIPF